MNKLLLIACMACTLTVSAQKAPIKFGDVTLEQLKMKWYEKDSSASALILVDYGVSYLEYTQSDGFVLKFERITRIKILTTDGLVRANFSIPLYHNGTDEEKVSGLKAVTYNLENGKIIESKMKSDATFKEKYSANRDFLKLTLPNVKVGSVIEITYDVTSDFLFNFQDWEFQDNIPVVWSEYRARIPEYFNYEKYMQGYVSIFISDQSSAPSSITISTKERQGGLVTQTSVDYDKIDFTENRFRWVAKDVPAFKPEPFITTYLDYVSKINFELSFTQFPNQPIKNYMGSWEDINKWYAERDDFGKEVTGNSFLKKIVEEITAGITTPEEKISVITNYVKQKMVWDGTNRNFPNSSLKKILEDKKGNSAEINLLLASMLEKADLDVSPVLLSTRDHGFVRETTPVSSQFNYVICLVRTTDKSILIDATEKLLPTGILPERCLNGNGFIISTKNSGWIALDSKTKSRTVYSADFALSGKGELKGKLNISRDGYDALEMREEYNTSGEQDYLKDYLGSKANWEVTKSEFQNMKEIDKAAKEIHELQINEHTSVAGDVIYLNPFVVGQLEKNPFTLETREYPVNYGSLQEVIYSCRFAIPEGFVIDEMPQSKVFMLAGNAAKYAYNVTQSGSTISVTSSFQINRPIFIQTEYPNLREFYNQVVAKEAEQIVLKKK